jgi:uncharacterized membrane protein
MENQSQEPEFRAWRKKVLVRTMLLCLVGLPFGIYLKIPYVWILSLIGILVCAFKLQKIKE